MAFFLSLQFNQNEDSLLFFFNSTPIFNRKEELVGQKDKRKNSQMKIISFLISFPLHFLSTFFPICGFDTVHSNVIWGFLLLLLLPFLSYLFAFFF